MRSEMPTWATTQRQVAIATAIDLRRQARDIFRRVGQEPIDGGALLADAFEQRHPVAETVRVYQLLLAVPWVGESRMRLMIAEAGIYPLARGRDLTDRQRDALINQLRARTARLRKQSNPIGVSCQT